MSMLMLFSTSMSSYSQPTCESVDLKVVTKESGKMCSGL